jgi:hypothetical protein
VVAVSPLSNAIVGAAPNSPSTDTAEDAAPEGMQLSPPGAELLTDVEFGVPVTWEVLDRRVL